MADEACEEGVWVVERKKDSTEEETFLLRRREVDRKDSAISEAS